MSDSDIKSVYEDMVADEKPPYEKFKKETMNVIEGYCGLMDNEGAAMQVVTEYGRLPYPEEL